MRGGGYEVIHVCRGCEVDLNPPPGHPGFPFPRTQVRGPETPDIGWVSGPLRSDIFKRKDESVSGLMNLSLSLFLPTPPPPTNQHRSFLPWLWVFNGLLGGPCRSVGRGFRFPSHPGAVDPNPPTRGEVQVHRAPGTYISQFAARRTRHRAFSSRAFLFLCFFQASLPRSAANNSFKNERFCSRLCRFCDVKMY